MQYNNVVLYNGIIRCDIEKISLRGGDASCQPENTGAADDGHLTVLIIIGVPAENAQSATVILSLREEEVERHEQPNLVECGESVGPLTTANDGGVWIWGFRQQVVHYRESSEACRRFSGEIGLSYLVRRWIFAGDYVVIVEMQLCDLFFRIGKLLEPVIHRLGPETNTERCRRNGGDQNRDKKRNYACLCHLRYFISALHSCIRLLGNYI